MLGCDEGISKDECLYYHDEDGNNTYELRDHGGTWFLREIFDILKEFLETTPFPDLDWDIQFGGNNENSDEDSDEDSNEETV